MNKIDWLYDDEEDDDGTFDLVGRLCGKYVDIVRDKKGSWSVFYNNVRLLSNIESREIAQKWAEQNNLATAIAA